MKNMILASIVISFLMIGCSDNSKKNAEVKVQHQSEQVSKKNVPSKNPVVVKKSKSFMDETKDVGTKVATVVKSSTQGVVKKSKELAKKVKNSEIVQKVVKKVSNETKTLMNMTGGSGMMTGGKSINTVQANAAPKEPKLFVKCAGCHGAKAQKHALGVSEVIAGWNVKKIENALHGYKNGTFGGVMKGVMKGQVSSLSDKDIKVLAQYISKL